jgi:hypothetical protein
VLNRILLVGYVAMFFGLVSSYEAYKDNTLLVVFAATLITAGGLAAWLVSIRGNSAGNDSEE